MLVGNQIVNNFLVKENLFNEYVSKQCTLIGNNSSIPANITSQREEKLSTLEICSGDIVKTIRSLDTNKAHGHDEISICICIYLSVSCASSI